MLPFFNIKYKKNSENINIIGVKDVGTITISTNPPKEPTSSHTTPPQTCNDEKDKKETTMSDFETIMNFYSGNSLAYKRLLGQAKGKNVIPFIGAGLSAFCYPTWNKLLQEMMTSVSDSCAKKAQEFVDKDDYYSAADTLYEEMDELFFYECFREAFKEELIDEDELKKQAAFYLPQFHFSTYITTNYDRVLEKAFEKNSISFETGFPYDTFRLNTFMREKISNPMIIKIHGDIRSNNKDLILTGKSYELHYADGAQLSTQLSRWAESKNFLFLGASLSKDRTVSLIENQMQEGMINYAIMGVSKDEINDVRERIKPLNIMPIFYNKKNHSSLVTILQQMLFDIESEGLS